MAGQLTCEWCGEPFERAHRRGPVPKYCSKTHRQRAYEDRQRRRTPDENVTVRPLGDVQGFLSAVEPTTQLSRQLDDLMRATNGASQLAAQMRRLSLRGSALTQLTKQAEEMARLTRSATRFTRQLQQLQVGNTALSRLARQAEELTRLTKLAGPSTNLAEQVRVLSSEVNVAARLSDQMKTIMTEAGATSSLSRQVADLMSSTSGVTKLADQMQALVLRDSAFANIQKAVSALKVTTPFTSDMLAVLGKSMLDSELAEQARHLIDLEAAATAAVSSATRELNVTTSPDVDPAALPPDVAAVVAGIILLLIVQVRAVATLAAAEAIEAGGTALELLGALDRHSDQFHGLLVLGTLIAVYLAVRESR